MTLIAQGDGDLADFGSTEAGGASTIVEDTTFFHAGAKSVKCTAGSGDLSDGRVNHATVYAAVGAYMAVSAWPSVQRRLLQTFYVSQTYAASIDIDPTGKIRAGIGPNATQTFITSAVTMTPNTWFLLEYLLHAQAATVTLDWAINGVAQTQVTNATDNDPTNDTRLGAPNPLLIAAALTSWVDEWVIGDAAGDYPTILRTTATAKAGKGVVGRL